MNDSLDRGLKDTFHVVLITRPMLFLSPQLCVYLIMISALLTSLLRVCLKSFFTPLYLWINLLTPLYSRVSRRRHVLNLKRKSLMCAHPCHVRHQNQEQSNMLTWLSMLCSCSIGLWLCHFTILRNFLGHRPKYYTVERFVVEWSLQSRALKFSSLKTISLLCLI